MLIPLHTDCPLKRIPWVNWALIAINIGIYMLTSVSADGAAQGPFAVYHGQAVRDFFALNPQNPQLYQYFTYQFLHESWLHVLGNMLFLYIFGNNINDRLGHLGYLAFYLAGGVAAGIGYAALDPSPVIGASGCVAAVTGAYLILLPRSNITLLFFFIYIGPIEISSLWFVLFTFLQDVLGEVRPGLLGGPESESVAHMAHITGTIFGALVCLILLALRLVPRDQFDLFSLLARWNRRRQYRSMVSQGYDPFGYVPPQPVDVRPQELDPRTLRMLEMRAEISEAIAHHNLPHAGYLYMELKKLDPTQVLSRQAQLDIANQLASQQYFQEAADAYEQFLTHYPNFEQIEQVELMLGVIYARYLQRYERARQLLLRALARLHTEREIQWARSELTRIEPLIAPQPGPK
jgi:membrane associated rhomboid family serine protease